MERDARRSAWLLCVPLLVFLGIFFVVPVGQMLLLALSPTGGSYSFDLIATVVADPFYQRVAIRTLRISLITTVLSLLIAYPVALHLRNVSPRWQSAIILVMVSPLLTSVVVRTLAWVVLLSQRSILNQAFTSAGLSPLRMLYVEGAVILGLVHVFFGYMVVSLMTSIRKIDENLYTATANLGASRWRQHLEITLPLSLPGVLTGALLVFILSASAYATPSLLGGLRVSMLAVEVFNQAITYFNWPEAAAISIALFVVIAVIVWAVTRVAESGKRKVIFQ